MRGCHLCIRSRRIDLQIILTKTHGDALRGLHIHTICCCSVERDQDTTTGYLSNYSVGHRLNTATKNHTASLVDDEEVVSPRRLEAV